MDQRTLHMTSMAHHTRSSEPDDQQLTHSRASVGHDVAATHWGDVVARFLLVALFALLPIFFIPVAWAGVGQSKMILGSTFVIFSAFFWTVARFSEGSVRLPHSALIPLVGLLPLAYLVSAAASGWNMASVVGAGVEQDTLVAIVVWYATLALAALICIDHRQTAARSVLVFAYSMTGLLIFQNIYILAPGVASLGVLQGETANLLGSWHDLGIVAGLALFLSGALLTGRIVQGVHRYMLVPLALSAVCSILVIHFKDVFWGVSALFFLGFAAVVRNAVAIEGASFLKSVTRGAPWLVAAALFLGLGFYNVQFAELLPSKIQVNEVEVRPSWQGTFDIARQSLGEPRDLVFGAGPNSFIREWGLYKPQEVNLTPFWNSDFNSGVGIIPTSIFAVGALGLIAWGGIILTIVFFFFRFIRETRPLVRGRALFGITLVGTAYLVAYHMIYTPGVALTGVTFLFLALLAVWASGEKAPRQFQIGVSSVPATLTGILMLVVCFGVVYCAGTAIREVVSNMLVNRAVFVYANSADLAQAGVFMQQALKVSPKNDRAHRAAAELGVLQLASLMQSDASDEAKRATLQETLERTIQHGLTAVEIEGNYQNWLTLAQIYGEFAGANVDGALESAVTSYEKAFETQPTNPIPKVRLAQIAIVSNDAVRASAYLKEAVALKPDLAIGYYLLSQVEAAQGNGDAAATAAAQAVQLVPNDPLGWFNLGYILYAGGAHTEATQALERAATLAPDYSNALFILGLSYNQLGRTNDAILVLERVAVLNTGESWIPQLIDNIRDGKDPFDGIGQSQ